MQNLSKKYETIKGTPQGSLISLILCNIFLHELDEFIENELKPIFNRGKLDIKVRFTLKGIL